MSIFGIIKTKQVDGGFNYGYSWTGTDMFEMAIDRYLIGVAAINYDVNVDHSEIANLSDPL